MKTQVIPQKEPWKFLARLKSGSVKELVCNGVFEFIAGKDRGMFMDEIYRVLSKDGKAAFCVPYWNSFRAVMDYRIQWPPLCEQSFMYFNKKWREDNKLDLKLKCDFDFTYGYTWPLDVASRNDETRAQQTRQYSNSVDALHLLLTKR